MISQDTPRLKQKYPVCWLRQEIRSFERWEIVVIILKGEKKIELGLWVDLDSEKSIFPSVAKLSNEINTKPWQYGKASEWWRTLTQTCNASEIKPLL